MITIYRLIIYDLMLNLFIIDHFFIFLKLLHLTYKCILNLLIFINRKDRS